MLDFSTFHRMLRILHGLSSYLFISLDLTCRPILCCPQILLLLLIIMLSPVLVVVYPLSLNRVVTTLSIALISCPAVPRLSRTGKTNAEMPPPTLEWPSESGTAPPISGRHVRCFASHVSPVFEKRTVEKGTAAPARRRLQLRLYPHPPHSLSPRRPRRSRPHARFVTLLTGTSSSNHAQPRRRFLRRRRVGAQPDHPRLAASDAQRRCYHRRPLSCGVCRCSRAWILQRHLPSRRGPQGSADVQDEGAVFHGRERSVSTTLITMSVRP